MTITAFATADHNFSAVATFVVTSPISISITQVPPNSLLTNSSAAVIAVVTNDPTNSGVTWTIESCDAAPCGSWSATIPEVGTTQTASGAPAVYFAPPMAVNHVKIQAAATASPASGVATVEISITAPISIAITKGITNDSIVKNGTASLVATVSDDATKAGVDWTVSCSSTGACGSFSLGHTDSGSPTTFTAPAAVPADNTVTITATSTADGTKSVSEIVTVTAGILPNSLLSGQFVISLSGEDANGGPYSLGGVIVCDGVGNITKGSLDLVDLGGGVGNTNAGNVPVLASTYSIGSDGRGQIQLKVNTNSLNGNFGVNNSGSVTLSIVFVTPTHAVLSETDTFGSGTGTLDLQNATDLADFQSKVAGLDGVYTLNLNGTEVAGSDAKYFVAGALTIHPGGSSYAESAYISDQSDKGAVTSVKFHSVAHTFANPLPNTFGELALDSVELGLPTKFSLNLWLIDSSHFVVTDWRDSFAGSPSVIVIGRLVQQPSVPSVSGTYAFVESGATAAPTFHPLVAGGIVTCGSTGTLDVTSLEGTALNNQAVSAACAAPANGRSLLTISGAGTTGVSLFAAYPNLDHGLSLLSLDGGAAGTSGPSGAGVALPQTSTSPVSGTALNGNYASSFLANTSGGLEAFAAQIISDGVSMLSGTADVNSFNTVVPPVGTPSVNATLTGSFTTGTDGRFPLVLSIAPATGQPTPSITNINLACYVVDSSTCLLLGLDATNPGTGILQLQQTGL